VEPILALADRTDRASSSMDQPQALEEAQPVHPLEEWEEVLQVQVMVDMEQAVAMGLPAVVS